MADEELKKKKRIRGGHKGYVTTTLEKVQGLLDNFAFSAANQVKTYRIALTEKLDILGVLDDEILTLIAEGNIEDKISETGIFRESIHQMIVQIDEALNAVEVENSGHTDKSISHYPSNSNSNSFTESLGAGKAKLPKIILKKFHGDPICFTPFWDSFRSAVDDNPCLSDVDKFNYLRNLLEGSAAGAIRGLPLTAENYGAAKDILKKRFGQPQIIINAHMEGLVKEAAVTVDNDLKRPRFLYDQVEAHVRALQALGIQCESYGKLLVPLLMEKLPPSMRLIISRAIDANRVSCTSEIQSRGRSVVSSDGGERRSNENKTSTTVYVDSNTSILLQTAIAQVSRVHQLHPVVNMRILFDSGSQRSYISERAKAKLNLPPREKREATYQDVWSIK